MNASEAGTDPQLPDMVKIIARAYIYKENISRNCLIFIDGSSRSIAAREGTYI